MKKIIKNTFIYKIIKKEIAYSKINELGIDVSKRRIFIKNLISSVIISTIIEISILNIFDESSLDAVITFFSIYIGLFMNMLILFYDKFHKIDDYSTSTSSANKITRDKNFITIFVVGVFYSILISILSIIILIPFYSVDLLSNNIIHYSNISELRGNLKIKLILLETYRLSALFLVSLFFIKMIKIMNQFYSYILKEFGDN